VATRIVAIDGHGGAGKSTLAEHVALALDGAAIIHTDDFASWENPVDWWPRLIEVVLKPLARSEAVRFKRSQWQPGQDRGWAEIRPASDVVLEGVSASREAFHPWLTYSIWVEAPPELRLARGLARDGEPSRTQWEEWMQAEEEYKRRERADERADLVLRGDLDLWT
jgi:uridine kinase